MSFRGSASKNRSSEPYGAAKARKADKKAMMDDALHSQKVLKWSRSVRDEARHTFFASRDSLRALYDLIEIKKAKLIETRKDVITTNAAVKKNRRRLRALCLNGDIPQDSILYRDAETSGDEKCDTNSITDISSFDEGMATEPKKGERMSTEI